MKKPKDRREKILLTKVSDGLWTAKSSRVKGSWCEGATPEEALANKQKALGHYDRFMEHLLAKCIPEQCETCRRNPVSRGGLVPLETHLAGLATADNAPEVV